MNIKSLATAALLGVSAVTLGACQTTPSSDSSTTSSQEKVNCSAKSSCRATTGTNK